MFASKETHIRDQNASLNKWLWLLRDVIDEANDLLDVFEHKQLQKQLNIKERLIKFGSLLRIHNVVSIGSEVMTGVRCEVTKVIVVVQHHHLNKGLIIEITLSSIAISCVDLSIIFFWIIWPKNHLVQCFKDIQTLSELEFVETVFNSKVIKKNYVYAFRVVLLELLIGRRTVEKIAPSHYQSLVTWTSFCEVLHSQKFRTGSARFAVCHLSCRRHLTPVSKKGPAALYKHSIIENMVRGKEKTNTSLRCDPSWKYNVQVDVRGGEKTYVYLKCNFYEKVVKGGVTRMKEHLSYSHKNVALSAKVPDKMNDETIAYMKKRTTAKHLQHEQFDERVEHGNFYEKVVKGGVTRMKEHLSYSHKNVALSAKVPDKMNDETIAYMKKRTTAKHLQHEQFDERVEHGAYFGSESGKGSSSTIHKARGPVGV
ncbi:hypothetical protein MA16_Dca015877 [Dendrobium catenatum]|uniref:BED-type domain-containing protein n=1 Tax=Dendrobium catenatum TaxID=906689 RepID=A0A2I0VMI3_9ASPA|nr:hypothetical protein MA16_Dca015877 [Dendrobium catenatum]